MKRSFLSRLKNKYVIGGAIILVIIAVVIIHRVRGNKPTYDTALVAYGNVMERVSVTGKILPEEKADLSFGKSGLVSVINVKVGDLVRNGQVLASIDNVADKAALAAAQAKLDDISRNLRPQELAVEQSKVNSATVALTNAKRDALNAAKTGYAEAQSAITNYADNFFGNPQSANPMISVRTQSSSEQNAINNERVLVTDTLHSWGNVLANATSTNALDTIISTAKNDANTLDGFIQDLSTIVNNLNAGNSGLSQNTIDQDVATMNSAVTNINQAVTSVTSAETALENAEAALVEATNNYYLKLAGSSSQEVKAQAASVEQYAAALDDDSIKAPFDGLVTTVNPTVGEFASPGAVVVTVISSGSYKIEANVPEADIAKITIGNMSSTTLDAYGQAIDFPATVISVDPAETIIEGVPTYKVTLHFLQNDARIRSGMTANLDILTHEHDHVLFVPSRAIQTDGDTKSVRTPLADGSGFTAIPVTTGLKGSDATTEIISGLNEGQAVITYVH